MANRQKLSKVTCLNEIRCFNRLQYSISLVRHLGMTGHDVLPPLLGEADWHAVNGPYRRHRYRRAALVDLTTTTILYGRRAFGVTSWSWSGLMSVGVDSAVGRMQLA